MISNRVVVLALVTVDHQAEIVLVEPTSARMMVEPMINAVLEGAMTTVTMLLGALVMVVRIVIPAALNLTVFMALMTFSHAVLQWLAIADKIAVDTAVDCFVWITAIHLTSAMVLVPMPVAAGTPPIVTALLQTAANSLPTPTNHVVAPALVTVEAVVVAVRDNIVRIMAIHMTNA